MPTRKCTSIEELRAAVRERLENADESVRKIGEGAGVAYSHVNGFRKHQDHPISLEMILKLAHYYEIPYRLENPKYK